MKVDPGCKYHEEHEWVRVEGNEGVIGVSDYAQEQLSDVVYVESVSYTHLEPTRPTRASRMPSSA